MNDYKDWWVVLRFHSGRGRGRKIKVGLKPVAMFATRAMASEWRDQAAHRVSDKIEKMEVVLQMIGQAENLCSSK